jgi:hypothetical protein
MSDLKMTCPGCDAHTSAVGIAYRDGDPCPYCGLPAEETLQRVKTARITAERSESARLSNILQSVATLVYEAEQAGAESVPVADLNAALGGRTHSGDTE